MAFITGSPSQEPRSSEEASEEEAPARRGSPPPAESDLELARRLQAEEEQGRPVARFKQLDCVEARYKDPELRGGTWSREYYLATVVDVIAPKTRSRAHEYMLRWDDGAEDQLVLEDYIRPAPAAPAPEAPAAAPREHDGLPKSGLANGLRTEAPTQRARGRRRHVRAPRGRVPAAAGGPLADDRRTVSNDAPRERIPPFGRLHAPAAPPGGLPRAAPRTAVVRWRGHGGWISSADTSMDKPPRLSTASRCSIGGTGSIS